MAGTQPSFSPISEAWHSTLDGSAVYGQPLVSDGKVLAATEDDNVYALDPATGKTLWKVNIGVPLTNVVSAAGCGDIDPLGVTSTGVIDPSTNTLYEVAEVSTHGSSPIRHELVGIDIATGQIVTSADADPSLPPGEDPIHLLQRASLLLANQKVYVGFGGQFGDCGLYHGWLVAIPIAHRLASEPAISFNVTPQSTGGAVWQGGGGPSADAKGNVYISTGNPNSGGSAPWAEAVVKLTPSLSSPPEAAFQDKEATGDLDLATGDVVVLPQGDVFAVGKTDIGYLLRQSDLSQVAPISGTICGSDPDGGAAYDSALDSIYVPCRDGGLTQIDLETDRVGWKSGSVNSGPILVDGSLWAVSYPNGELQQIDPASGAVEQTISVGMQVPNFASPSSALGLLLVGTSHGVAAFK